MLTSMPQTDGRPEGTLGELRVDSCIGTPAPRREVPCKAVARLDPDELEPYLSRWRVTVPLAWSLGRIVAGPAPYRQRIISSELVSQRSISKQSGFKPGP